MFALLWCQEKPSGVYTMQETACDVATAHWTRVHNSNVVRAALATARMSAGYQREPLALKPMYQVHSGMNPPGKEQFRRHVPAQRDREYPAWSEVIR